eukprot:EG_transcript_4361
MFRLEVARRFRAAGQQLLRCWRFGHQEMESQFQALDERFTISLAYFWIALTSVFMVVSLLARCNKFGWFQHPDLAFYLYFIPLGFLAVAALLLRIPWFKTHSYYLLSAASFLSIVWIAFSVHLSVMEDRREIEATVLTPVFKALQHADGARQLLHQYLAVELGRKYLWYALVVNLCNLNLLQFLNLTWVSVAVFVSVPLSLVAVSFASPLLRGQTVEMLVFSFLVLLYTVGLSFYMVLSRRRQFELSFQLQRTLQKEAEALKEVAQQEAALKEASQEADTVLNHLLKNVMADAAGCIHLYLQSLPAPLATPAPPPDLVQATECLQRGVAWCRKRQALLRIASGQYTPQMCEVDLARFGHSLLQGRPIDAEFPTELVMMDPLLCEIVLENALTNAHRHGHPTHPALRFTATLASVPGGNSPPRLLRRRLTFSVTNRANPARPPLTPGTVTRLLSGEWQPSNSAPSQISEHLGLQHLCQAARAHDMGLRLFQVEDTVHLEASLEVNLAPFAGEAPSLAKQESAVVPPDLRVFCIDDSPVARRLLVHTLSRPPMQASVTAFGESAQEVEDFLQAAVDGADIVILDYHLDYGHVHFLGTDLLRMLLDRGYRGLACVRSANATAFDEAAYSRAGAHCCIGKDVPPRAMAQALMAAYLSRQARLEASQTCRSLPVEALRDVATSSDAGRSHCLVSLPGSTNCLEEPPV